MLEKRICVPAVDHALFHVKLGEIMVGIFPGLALGYDSYLLFPNASLEISNFET